MSVLRPLVHLGLRIPWFRIPLYVIPQKEQEQKKEQQKKALVQAAQQSVNLEVSSTTSHRPITNPPANQKGKKRKVSAKRSETQPVSTEKSSKKRQAKQSATEPVSTEKSSKKQKTSPGDQRSGLDMLNPPAKNNTNVAKGRKVQIKWGRTVYNAKVTKVLDGGFVNVCTKDKDERISKTNFKIVRLTEEQAKSDKQHGFTNKKANAGFEVAGAHDD